MLEFKDILKQKNVRKMKETEPGISDDHPDASKAGLPDMNVNFTYDNPTNNGIALITKAVMYEHIQALNDTEHPMSEEDKAAVLDIIYNPGYAPMERLVRAIVFGRGSVDPYNMTVAAKSTHTVDFANDLERIAFAICPEMFAKTNSHGKEKPKEKPGPVEEHSA